MNPIEPLQSVTPAQKESLQQIARLFEEPPAKPRVPEVEPHSPKPLWAMFGFAGALVIWSAVLVVIEVFQ